MGSAAHRDFPFGFLQVRSNQLRILWAVICFFWIWSAKGDRKCFWCTEFTGWAWTLFYDIPSKCFPYSIRWRWLFHWRLLWLWAVNSIWWVSFFRDGGVGVRVSVWISIVIIFIYKWFGIRFFVFRVRSIFIFLLLRGLIYLLGAFNVINDMIIRYFFYFMLNGCNLFVVIR